MLHYTFYNWRWSGCFVNLLVSLVDLSCQKLWQRRFWMQQGFFIFPFLNINFFSFVEHRFYSHLLNINFFLHPLRLHIDTDLDERVQYILKTYEYICKVSPNIRIHTKTYEYICKVSGWNRQKDKHHVRYHPTHFGPLYTNCWCQDETNFARILSTVEKYAGRRSGETWGELESRSNYKELVSESRRKRRRICFWHRGSWENMFLTHRQLREYVFDTQAADMRDVHNLISRLADSGGGVEGEGDLQAHLFLIAPKIDFRQSSAPNFLTDS